MRARELAHVALVRELRPLADKYVPIARGQLVPIALVRELRAFAEKIGPVRAVKLRPVALVRELRMTAQNIRQVPSVQLRPVAPVRELRPVEQKIVPVCAVQLVDGSGKTLEKPKIKNLKHIEVLNGCADIVAEKFVQNKKVFDAEVYSVIKKFKNQ